MQWRMKAQCYFVYIKYCLAIIFNSLAEFIDENNISFLPFTVFSNSEINWTENISSTPKVLHDFEVLYYFKVCCLW